MPGFAPSTGKCLFRFSKILFYSPLKIPPWGIHKSILQKVADSEGGKGEYTAAIPLVSSADGQLRVKNVPRFVTAFPGSKR